MGDHDDGQLLSKPGEQFVQGALGLGVDAGGGLVEQQQPGLARQGPGQKDALLLAARQLADLAAAELGHAHLFERFCGGLAVFAGVAPEQAPVAAHEHYFGDVDGELCVEQRLLGQIADAAPRLGGRAAADQDLPTGRLHQAEDDLEQGGLAPAVGADHGEEVVGGDGQVHSFEHGFFVEVDPHIAQLDDWR